MKLSSFREYLTLRRHLVGAWRFTRTWRKPLTDDRVVLHLRDGSSLTVRGPSTDRRIFHTIFARDEYRLEGLGPGAFDTVVDVGAHIGIFALRVAPLARRVLCYEPVPANLELLRSNADQPRCAHVEVFPWAVADAKGKAEFWVSESDASAHTMLPDKEGCGVRIEVEAVTLAGIFQEQRIETCDLLKLDCEGAEYRLLESMPPELWPRIRRIFLEFHPGPPGRDAAWLTRFLTDRGFACDPVPRRTHPDRGMFFAIAGP